MSRTRYISENLRSQASVPDSRVRRKRGCVFPIVMVFILVGGVIAAYLLLKPVFAPSGGPSALPVAPSGSGAGCAPVALFALRGSGEPAPSSPGSLSDSPTLAAFASGLRGGLTHAPTVVNIDYTAMALPTVLIDPNRLNDDIGGLGKQTLSDLQQVLNYQSSINDGVSKLIAALVAQHQSCPSQKFVLAGYSQGAWAVHTALNTMVATPIDSGAESAISAVALIADPLQTGAVAASLPSAHRLGTASGGANGIVRQYGLAQIMTQIQQKLASFGLGGDGSASLYNTALPNALLHRVVALCQNDDLICDASASAPSIAVHTSCGSLPATVTAGTVAADMV